MKKAHHNQLEMARNLCVHKSIISRELKSNQGQRGYRPKQADELAQERQQRRKRYAGGRDRRGHPPPLSIKRAPGT